MVLETRNQRIRVQVAINPSAVEELSERITRSQAREQMRLVTVRAAFSPWSKATTDWCNAMKDSMAALQGRKHFDNEYWITCEKTQDAIRRSVCQSNRKESKKLFSFNKKHSHKNGYFAFRPVSAEKTDEVYSLLACMKVLSDSNDNQYKHYVRLYRWIEREMTLRTSGGWD